MATLVWNDPEHQCYGCIHNIEVYKDECDGCRRKANSLFNTSTEDEKLRTRVDKYKSKVKFGTHRVLVKK